MHSFKFYSTKMASVYWSIYLICINLCVYMMPVTELTTTDRSGVLNHFNSGDLKDIKFAVKTLAEHFGKWNYMYMSQIEPKLVSSLITLTNIDSNIKNLQERAHIWDTFQLHVAAWNDQLSTSDRKLDIISKAQEGILSLQEKINKFTEMEYKIDKILNKINQFEENLDNISKKLENTSQFREGLIGEFATRGVLSTLRSIERKMDRIILSKTYNNEKAELIKKSIEESQGRLTIKCNTPPMVEELLHDVASKVDIIFDKISESDNEEFENADYMDDQNRDALGLNLDKTCKRMNQSWKQIKRQLEYLEKSVLATYNNTSTMLENEAVINEKYESFLTTNFKLFISSVRSEASIINSNVNKMGNEQKQMLDNHFRNESIKYNKILTAIQDHEPPCIHNPDSNRNKQKLDSFVPFTSLRHVYTNKSSCDDIEFGENNGIYHLGNSFESNNIDYTYYTRFCEVRNDASWTIIQSRNNYEILQNFTLDWYNYKVGFGQLEADFWFGNDFIHKLSHEEDLLLRIELEDFDGNNVWAEYNEFKVDSENENYKLTIGEYRGNASDSFSSHNNSLFSTFDVKNDDAPDCCPCAESFGGGWWFNSCFESNLNGVYYRNSRGKDLYRGIIWEHWLGDYSLKKTKMMVRRKDKDYDDEITTTVNVYKFLEDP